MTSGQRLHLICRTLLLPLRDPSFGNRDLLVQKTKCYRDFLERSGQESKLYRAYVNQRNALIERLCQDTSPQRLDEVQQMLEMFYGDPLLYEQLTQAQNLDRFYLRRIAEISDSFVTLRDGRPALRFWTRAEQADLFGAHTGLHKAELWNTLVRLSTPDLWIAAYYINIGAEDVHVLSHVSDELLLADQVLMKKLSVGFAETHMHFNAGLDYQALWELVSDVTALQHSHGQLERYGSHLETLLKAGMLRLFLASYLLYHAPGQDFQAYCKACLPETMAGTHDILAVLQAGIQAGPAAHDQCVRYFQHFETNTRLLKRQMDIAPLDRNEYRMRFDLLSRSVFSAYYPLNTSCDILLFWMGLRHVGQGGCPQFCRALLQYIRWKNYFFESIHQWEGIHGLRRFRSFYQRAAGAVYSMHSQDHDRLSHMAAYAAFRSQSRTPYLKRMEMKINPPEPSTLEVSRNDSRTLMKNKIARQVWIMLDAYIQFIRESLQDTRFPRQTDEQKLTRLHQTDAVSFPTPGILYHFTKPDLLRSSFGRICWAAPDSQKANSPHYIETLRQQSMMFCDVLHEMILNIPHLGDYIVGLDAASEELNIEPWVYAPVFRYARSRRNTYPRQLCTRMPIPNLGLTYHVGEEFRHLVSGLRVTDEVLEHFGFKAGDRLGHAISLQADPLLWQQENQVCSLPTLEYLENLLWLWNLKNTEPELELIADVGKRILETAESLYGKIDRLTPYLLWSAYQKKFSPLDPTHILHAYNTCEQCMYRPLSMQPAGICPLSHAEQSGDWTIERLLLTHFCPRYLERYRKPLFVQVPRDEVQLLRQLQRILKKKAGQLGITIEVNPTSNASIGAIPGIFEHPILRLNNRGLALPDQEEQHLAISINSDDPLVFHTSVENEISYIYYKITDMGYCREDVLNWVDQVRRCGMESSFIRRVKPPGVLLRELQTICDALQQQYLHGRAPV